MAGENKEQRSDRKKVDTGGGAHVEGGVTTGGGDFVGRDKIIYEIRSLFRIPPGWQSAISKAFRTHGRTAVVVLILTGLYSLIFLRYRNLYRLPNWQWGAISVLIVLSAAGLAVRRRSRDYRSGILAAAALLALILVLGLQVRAIAMPVQFEEPQFGIAIAELGEGARFQRTDLTSAINGQIYELLCQNIVSSFADLASDQDCEDRELPVRILRLGVMPDTNMATAFGRRIHADIVIWGQVLPSQEGISTIHFQLIEIPDTAVNPKFPVVLPVASSSTEIVNPELNLGADPVELKDAISQQATVLSAFTLGLYAYTNLDYTAAFRHFESANEALQDGSLLEVSDPGKSLIHFYLGRSYQALGNLNEGQGWLEVARTDNPDEPANAIGLALGHGSLGNEQAKNEMLDLALDLLDVHLRENPDDARARYDRGLIYFIQQQYRLAEVEFKNVIELDPDFYATYIILGRALDSQGNSAEAIKYMEMAIKTAEQSGTNPSWAYLNLANVYDKMGSHDQARAHFQTAIDLDPEVDWIRFFMARFLENQGEVDAAILAYKSMIEVTEKKGWAYGELAAFYWRRELYSLALENFIIAVADNPTDALLRVNLAMAMIKVDQNYEGAFEEFERAIELNPDISYIYSAYADGRFEFGDYQGAGALYQKAFEIDPTNSAALLNQAEALVRLGEFAAAIELYCWLLNSDVEFSSAHLEIARDKINNLNADCPLPTASERSQGD